MFTTIKMELPKLLPSVCFVYCFLVLVFLSHCGFADEHQHEDHQVSSADEEDEAFYPKKEVMEPLLPKYPYQEYIQVRKVITVEHVPSEGSSIESSNSRPKNRTTGKKFGANLISPEPSASNIQEGINQMNVYHPGYAQPAEGQQNLQAYASNQQGYFRDPRLREEIFEKKKQEVYEERGYGDSAYDHSSHGKYYQDQDGYHQRHHLPPSHQEESGTSAAASTGVKQLSPGRRYQERGMRLKNKATTRRNNNNKKPKVNNKGDLSPAVAASKTRHRQAVKPPTVHPMLSAGSSSDLLKYASNHLHDQRGTKLGFYQSRAHIHCPEVVDFDLGSKNQGMGGPGPVGKNKRRLHGLGAKIDCLKNKYFGSATQMLPRAIFPPPEISAKTLIKMGSMQDFLKEFRNEFHGF